VIAAMAAGAQVALVAVVAVLLLGSGALAAAETSLVRTSKVKARSLADDQRRGSSSLVRLVEHPQRFLNPLLLLVLICQLVSATLIGLLADQWFGVWGVLAGTAFEVVVIFVFFEAVPKNWAVHHPERAALSSAPLVDWLTRFPLVRALSSVLIGFANLVIGKRGDAVETTAVTESELLAMADVARDEDVIDAEEREFIHSVIDFGDTVVREAMVPRPDMEAIEATMTVSGALVEALEAGFSRLPVYAESVDDVCGIAYTKDLMKLERAGQGAELVGGHMRRAHFVPETKQVAAMLREMQESKFHLAIVVDEYGGTAGLITLEDVLEELVGEIVDEFDVDEPGVEQLDEDTVVVAGRMSIDEVDDLLDAELPKGSWDTIGGLLLDLVGGVPEDGEAAEVDGFRLVAAQVDGRRVERVRIERLEATSNVDA
jgi:CBS domain containing-hemolysin-like protein